MIVKYVSSKEILDRVYSSTGIQEDISYYDVVNWIYSVLELVNYPMQYIPKAIGWKSNSELDFKNYVFPLPEDFHSLDAMIINGVQAVPSNSDVHQFLNAGCCSEKNVSPDLSGVFTDNFGNIFSNTEGLNAVNQSINYTFTINNNVVTVNVKEGKACIAYKAYPVDKDGFPLVPDVEKYKMAIEMFIRMKLDYINWRNDPDSKGKYQLYQDSQREYEFYVASVSNHLKMGDKHEMNNLKNQMLRLFPRVYKYEEYFKTLSFPKNFRN